MIRTWEILREELRAASDLYLSPGGCASPRQLRERIDWLDLFPVETVLAWVCGPNGFPAWLAAMMRNFHPDAIRLGRILLRGFLRDLRTRTEPAGLLAYWDAVAAVWRPAAGLADLFREQTEPLRQALRPPEEQPIAVQEQAFTAVLARCRDRLRAAGAEDAGHPLHWTVPLLTELIAERTRPTRRQPGAAVAQVVFAWDNAADGPGWNEVGLAPGLLVSLTLAPKAAADDAEPIDGPSPFDRTFLETLKQVQAQFEHRFYPLHHGCGRFGPMSLKGSSGGLAIGVAEYLAGHRLRLGAAGETLPPWVAITATLDPKTAQARPVNSFAQKAEVLRRAGVRVVPVANGQPVAESLQQRMAREGVHLLRVRGSISEVAEQLRRQPRLIDLWPAGDQSGLITRRRFLVGGLSAAAAGVAGFWTWNALAPSSEALRAHDLALMRKHAAAYKADPDRYLRERQQPGSELERDLTLPGLRVLLDSKLYDMVDWVDAAGVTNEELIARPIEPAYVTRVIRLVKPKGYAGPGRFTVRMDTGGHRVVPILDDTVDANEVSWRFNTMEQARKVGGKVRSTYVTIDISRYEVGVPFDVVLRAIYWNGGQDQQVRHASSDWWGTRLQQGTQAADLAVHFPSKPIKLFSYHRQRYKQLPDGSRIKVEGAWDDMDPAEWDPKRTCPPGAIYRMALLVPVGPFDAPETIYAIQFSWA